VKLAGIQTVVMFWKTVLSHILVDNTKLDLDISLLSSFISKYLVLPEVI
jgi:hypothetical protein